MASILEHWQRYTSQNRPVLIHFHSIMTSRQTFVSTLWGPSLWTSPPEFFAYRLVLKSTPVDGGGEDQPRSFSLIETVRIFAFNESYVNNFLFWCQLLSSQHLLSTKEFSKTKVNNCLPDSFLSCFSLAVFTDQICRVTHKNMILQKSNKNIVLSSLEGEFEL